MARYHRYKIPDLQKELDGVFSEFIRLRDTNANLYGKCITCPKIVHYAEADCGHFFSRRFINIRYHENNAHLQCRECNRLYDGRADDYEIAMLFKYGQERIDELIALKNEEGKKYQLWYLDQIVIYGDYIKHMREIKKMGGDMPPIFFQ